MTIWFDMDGTIADLYAVDNWLDKLCAYDATPYSDAKVMWNMSQLARLLNKAQAAGYELGIISWLSKHPTPEYDTAVIKAKEDWLKLHLKSVKWNEIHIVSHGSPKQQFMKNNNDILFDDEEKNRNNWNGQAYRPEMIINILKSLISATSR